MATNARASDDWRRILSHGLQTPEAVAKAFGKDPAEMARVTSGFPVRINEYYRGLIQDANDPIGRQVIPSEEELLDPAGVSDPLSEDTDTPVPHLVHRYPDRILFLVTYQCAVYCRFCTRKRVVGRSPAPSDDELLKAIDYIRQHTEIRDVIVSGGDPLTLSDERLGRILEGIRSIPHVEILRVDTRMPCSLPLRVTDALCGTLRQFHPLYVNTHFNHPREVTPQAADACTRLADHGIPVGNQTVLLKGVNDCPSVMRDLVQRLLAIRVRPYYLYQCDPVNGTCHFRTDVEKGLEILAALRGRTSGMGVPTYVIDTPGGGGKVPLLPNAIVNINSKEVTVRDHAGNHFTYPQASEACGALK